MYQIKKKICGTVYNNVLLSLLSLFPLLSLVSHLNTSMYFDAFCWGLCFLLSLDALPTTPLIPSTSKLSNLNPFPKEKTNKQKHILILLFPHQIYFLNAWDKPLLKGDVFQRTDFWNASSDVIMALRISLGSLTLSFHGLLCKLWLVIEHVNKLETNHAGSITEKLLTYQTFI